MRAWIEQGNGHSYLDVRVIVCVRPNADHIWDTCVVWSVFDHALLQTSRRWQMADGYTHRHSGGQ